MLVMPNTKQKLKLLHPVGRVNTWEFIFRRVRETSRISRNSAGWQRGRRTRCVADSAERPAKEHHGVKENRKMSGGEAFAYWTGLAPPESAPRRPRAAARGAGSASSPAIPSPARVTV